MAVGDDNDAGGEKFGLFFSWADTYILILLCHKDSTSMRHFPFSTSRLYILGTLSGNGLDSGSVVCGDLGEIQRISLGKHRCCCKSSFMGVPNTLSGCWEKWSEWI